MKPDDTAPQSAPDADAWLDGLAGRGGTSEPARDGAWLRDALNPTSAEQVSVAPPLWQDIVSAARPPNAEKQVHHQPAAANDSRWRLVAGGIAIVALVLGAGLWTMLPRDDGASGAMRGASTAVGAQWRAANPREAAQELAQRLEAAGARVVITPQGAGLRVDVACAPSACASVNEQLLKLEAAVDADGRLALQVLPLN